MHEFSLMADLMRKIELVAHEQNAEKVIKIDVELGALSHMSPSHFEDHFRHASEGTIAEGAQLCVISLTDENDPHAQDIRLTSLEVSV